MIEKHKMNILVLPSGIFPSQKASSINIHYHAECFTKYGKVTCVEYNNNYKLFTRLNSINYVFLQKKYKRYLWLIKNANKFDLIFSRNILFSFFILLFSKGIVINDIHANPNDFRFSTKILFKILIYFNNSYFVFISKSLYNDLINKRLLNKSIILGDVSAWEYTCDKYLPQYIVYFGSIDESKNWRIICELANIMPQYKFKVYALTKPDNFPMIKNLTIEISVPYIELSKLISKEAKVVLIPNLEIQNLDNIDIGNYTSPLKFFDALALRKAIICNDITVFNDYKDLPNVFVAKSTDVLEWSRMINIAYNSEFNINIKYNFPISYSERVEKICNFIHV
jgi:hypothetical protein